MKYKPVAFQSEKSLETKTKLITKQQYFAKSLAVSLKAKFLQAMAELSKNLMLRSMILCERAPTSLVNQYGSVSPVARRSTTRTTWRGTLNRRTSSSLASVATSVENFPRQETPSEATFTQCIKMPEFRSVCGYNIVIIYCLQDTTEQWKNWIRKSTLWCARLKTTWDTKFGSASPVERWLPEKMTCLGTSNQST